MPADWAPGVFAKVKEFLHQRGDPDEQQRILLETRLSLERLERTFGISSDRIHQVIDNGTLVETFKGCRWILATNLLARAESR